MKYLRVYADAEFETHLIDLVEDAPQAALTAAIPVVDVQMFYLPPSTWQDDQHPAPRRQLVFILAGGLEIEASDGNIRRLTAGAVLLAEDTTGNGHRTRSVDGQELAVAWMPLVDRNVGEME